jgi:mRNA interferase RelE/StbE
MTFKISWHPEAKKEFNTLDESIKKLVAKQIVKLERSPYLGEKLGNKQNMDLSEYRKVYADKKKIRIVYKIKEDVIEVFIIAIGEREDFLVYQDAFKRKN